MEACLSSWHGGRLTPWLTGLRGSFRSYPKEGGRASLTWTPRLDALKSYIWVKTQTPVSSGPIHTKLCTFLGQSRPQGPKSGSAGVDSGLPRLLWSS